MAGIGTYLSIIILTINGISSPTKRHRLVDWIKKRRPNCDLKHAHLTAKDVCRLKVNIWKMIFHTNRI